VKNYAGQQVFAGPTLSVPADFAIALDPSLVGNPSPGPKLDPWLGELSLLPTGCHPGSLIGRRVRVTVLWLLNGAIGNVPQHGIYLGSYQQDLPVAYPDAQAITTRTVNSLAPVELTHTFTDANDGSEGLFLRAYLLGQDGETPTTFHVQSIVWEQAGTDAGSPDDTRPEDGGAAQDTGTDGADARDRSDGEGGPADGGGHAPGDASPDATGCGHAGQPCCSVLPYCAEGACYPGGCFAETEAPPHTHLPA
jgi:hypothetical protein